LAIRYLGQGQLMRLEVDLCKDDEAVPKSKAMSK
jgi:hypothetical protein